jgi:hypothetical protein
LNVDFQTVLTLLSMLGMFLPLLGNAGIEGAEGGEGEGEHAEGGEEGESAEGSEGSEGEGEPEKYFLEVNDRTRYKTPEDALKAFNEAGQTIAGYSRLGKPEEISERLQRLELLEQFAGGKKDPRQEKSDPYEGMDDDTRKQWQASADRFDPILKDRGYVKTSDVEKLVEKRVGQALQQNDLVGRAHQTFNSLAKERGVELNPFGRNLLEQSLASVMNDSESEQGRELNRRFFAGDAEGVMKDVFEAIYGPAGKSNGDGASDSEGDGRQRDAQGRFLKGADVQDTKDKTGKLPSPPPKGGKAPAKGGDDDRAWTIDPKERLKRARQQYAELTGS